MNFFQECLNRSAQQWGAEYAEHMGYDAGKNGPNETNCHFSIFRTRELTAAWERGKARAEREQQR